MLDWIQEHRGLLYGLASISLVLFVGTLVAVPMLVARIPPDYFEHEQRPPVPWADRHPLARIALRACKNALGWVLVAAGLAMLVLPGQGLLTILVGFLLLDLPGKYRMEKWLVSRRRILASINWLRRRTGREPLSVGDR
jgi:hypothetical protein